MKAFKINWAQEIRRTVIDIIASICVTISVNIFAAPNSITPGGVSGISVLINHLFGLPIATVNLFFNIPLLIFAWRIKGREFALRTLRTLVTYTVLSDVFFSNVPFTYEGDVMMAILFGGLFSGLSTAIIFSQGGTFGGTEIINRLIQIKYPYFSTGQLSLTLNAVVLCAAALVYRDINAALYGLVFSFVSGKVIDSILNGADMGKCALIVTHHPDEISKHIIEDLRRSATIIDATGAYLKDDTSVLLCVVRKQQFYELKKFVAGVDPKAFVIITDATQIIGTGFKPINAE